MAAEAFLSGDVGRAAAEIAARVRESVVEVRSAAGAGAGTIWRPDGTVVTNHHVVPRDEAAVTLADGRSFTAAVVARDRANDLAALRLAAQGLAAVTPGD